MVLNAVQLYKHEVSKFNIAATPLHIQFNSIKRFTHRVHMHKNRYFISKVIKARVHRRRAHIFPHLYFRLWLLFMCHLYRNEMDVVPYCNFKNFGVDFVVINSCDCDSHKYLKLSLLFPEKICKFVFTLCLLSSLKKKYLHASSTKHPT